MEVADARSARPYILLRKDVYVRVRNLIFDDSDWTEQDLRLQLGRSAAANGWDEPVMDEYDRYDEERRERCR